MKKLLSILLSFLMLFHASAADIEITEDFSVEVDKEALLAALYEADISSLRKAIDLKLITCQELTEYYLERIEMYNDTFQCFITLCDNAVDIAKQRDAAIADGTAKGSLFGIPIVVKDNIHYEGYPTTNGMSYYYAYPSSKSAAIVQYLLDEGAVILGKTNMSAAAQDALCSINASGLQTFNAYNPDLASGGSSGGSAVAVSLNFAAAALGTDTSSSLRYPSALNGCVTLRPTYSLIERDGCIILNYSRDTAGAITRSVLDQAIMLDALTCGVHKYTERLNENALDGMRIGVLSEFSYPIPGSYNREDSDLDDEIQAAFDNAVNELTACGAEIITVSMPTILNEVAGNEVGTSPRLYTKLEALMSENSISAIIYPTYLHTPQYTTREHLKGKSIYDFPYICNCSTFSPLTGAPEISVPIGRHSRGAGIGMEILALRDQDQLLLDIAYSYTQKYDHRSAPEIAPSLHVGQMDVSLHAFLMMYEQAVHAASDMQIASTDTQPTTTEEPPIPIESADANADSTKSAKSSLSFSDLWYFIIPPSVVVLGAGIYFMVRQNKKRISAQMKK